MSGTMPPPSSVPSRGSFNRSRENSRVRNTLSPSQNQDNDNMEDVSSDGEDDPSEPTDSQAQLQIEVNQKLLLDWIARVSRCLHPQELLRTVPAPAQAVTKNVLDKVMESFTKQGACSQLHSHWKDCLARNDFKTIPELNSLKSPLVQVSKLAKEADEAAINTANNFEEVLQEARRAALSKMIEIKKAEVKSLKSLCNQETLINRLHLEWQQVAAFKTTTPEHMAILQFRDCVKRLVISILSIGQNSLQQSAILKQNKLKKRAEADTNKTDIVGNHKELESVVKAMLKRNEQSKRDRQKSKKGKGRAGPPSKQKNQKTGQTNNGVQKKKPRTPQKKRKGKKGSSTKRQQYNSAV
jgi:hypothetical protein